MGIGQARLQLGKTPPPAAVASDRRPACYSCCQPPDIAAGGSALYLILGSGLREQFLSGVWLDIVAEGKSVISPRLALKVSSRSDKPSVKA